MATVEEEPAADTGSWTEREVQLGVDRLTAFVAGLTVLALALRLVALGERTAHWDEARVAWWTLDFIRTGSFEYRPIIHGPFYHHVNRLLFAVFGATDAAMRVAPAVIGGLFPLSVLGLRHRLRDTEVIALAALLAVNPIILYYSRFMRGDPIVAFCTFAAFVLFVRAVDFGSRAALLGGFGLLAVAFTAKENALVYVVTWAGASVLLLDHRLFTAADRGRDWVDVAWRYLSTAARRTWAWLPWLAVGLLEFLVIIVYFYAPRSPDPDAVALNNVGADPGMAWDVIVEATYGSWTEFYGLWVSGSHQDHSYIPYLGHYLETMLWGALVLSLLAVVGFLVDRYAEDGPGDLVSFCFYWGFVSVLGYPIITDIKAPWATLHAVVPLAVPAAVGLAVLLRWAHEAFVEDDRLSLAVSAVLVLVLAGTVVGASGYTVYYEPQSDENQLVQYAQPGDDLGPTTERLAAVAAENEGTDVLLYGDYFVDGDQDAVRSPACVKWFNSLPLPWYLSAEEATVDCANSTAEFAQKAEQRPPLVIVRDAENTTARQQFPDYWTATYELRTYNTDTVVLFRPDVARETDLGRDLNGTEPG